MGYSADARKYPNTLLGHLEFICAINNVQFYRGGGAVMALHRSTQCHYSISMQAPGQLVTLQPVSQSPSRIPCLP